MKSILHHPATILAALGAVSGTLGSYGLGANYGDAPELGLYMVFAGLWFGLVIGYGLWRWGDHSLSAAAIAVAATWIAWEAAVNVGLQLDQRWLVGTAVPDGLKSYVTGFAAGGVGALLTWVGAAATTPALRQASTPGLVVSTGALFGLLLPATNQYDYPAILLLPWQAAVAAAFGLSLAPGWSRLDLSRATAPEWPRRRVRLAGLRAKPPGMTQTKKRLAILISGRGSNMMSLLAAAREPDYPVEIACVISNRPEAQGLFKASGEGLPTRAIDHKGFGSREGFEAALDAGPRRIQRRPHRLRRLHAGDVARLRRALARPHAEHPSSLLPAFTGLNTHARALAAGVKIAGCTVHVVRAEVDSGPIIAQAAVPVLDGDTPETLGARVLEAEHLLYPHALSLFASGAITVSGDRTIVRQAAVNQAKPLFWPPFG